MNNIYYHIASLLRFKKNMILPFLWAVFIIEQTISYMVELILWGKPFYHNVDAAVLVMLLWSWFELWYIMEKEQQEGR